MAQREALGAEGSASSAPEYGVVITGASAGIGRALAENYAAPGVALGLIARDGDRLAQVAEVCRRQGATVVPGRIDVTNGPVLTAWIADFDQRFPLNLLIANAGVTAAFGGPDLLEEREQAQDLIDINLTGVVNAVYAAVPGMRARGRGQIALVSSLAAWRGMALTPLYSGTKAAVKAYGEALRDLLAPVGVGVTVVCPGFVETAMSDRFPGPRPRMISAARAAVRIRRGLERNAALVAFPLPLALGMRLLSILPFGLASFFLRALSLQPPRTVNRAPERR